MDRLSEEMMGISFGSRYCSIATFCKGFPISISDDGGNVIIPSVVCIPRDEKFLVGEAARRCALIAKEQTIYGDWILQFGGKNYSIDRLSEIRKEIPVRITFDQQGKLLFEICGKQYKIVEIFAMMLQKFKEYAENFLGKKINQAIIAVPAHSYHNSGFVIEGGKLAGFDNVSVINRCQAIMRNLKDLKRSNHVAVCDLSENIFNISTGNITDDFSIKINESYDIFGDEKIRTNLIRRMINDFKRQHEPNLDEVNLEDDILIVARFKEAANIVLLEVSSDPKREYRPRDLLFSLKINKESLGDNISIVLPFLYNDKGRSYDYKGILTQEDLQEVNAAIKDELLSFVQKTIKMAELRFSSIDELVVLGHKEIISVFKDVIITACGREPLCIFESHEAAAKGALLSSERHRGTLLIDVTPLSLRIETAEGSSAEIIPRNTMIPYNKSIIFSTALDLQTNIRINVLQGECLMARDNVVLGKFDVVGLLPAPRGIPQIEVNFSIDANGIVRVTAQELSTGNVQRIEISPSKELVKNNIERIIKQKDTSALLEAEKAECTAYVAGRILDDIEEQVDEDWKANFISELTDLKIAIREYKEGQISNKMLHLSTMLSDLFFQIEIVSGRGNNKTHQPHIHKNKKLSNNPLEGFNVMKAYEGGMGKVYIVERGGSIFAAKTVKDEYLSDPRLTELFLAEVKTWVEFGKHPNIVFAFFAREFKGRPWLFLEYLGGGNLTQFVGTISIIEAIDFAIQICNAMDYTWRKSQVVHRDIKPSNILFAEDKNYKFGKVAKITDFGLTKAFGILEGNFETKQQCFISRGRGTWPYMPPEQFTEDILSRFSFTPFPVTQRSDIYSFGVTFYELLTGKLPFNNIEGIFKKDPNSLRVTNPKVPFELDNLIMKCLQKSSTARYNTFSEILHELIFIYENMMKEKYVLVQHKNGLSQLESIGHAISFLTIEDYENANIWCEKAIKINPKFPSAWICKAELLMTMGHYNDALNCYEEAIRVNPNSYPAWNGKAHCLTKLRKYTEAIKCYEKEWQSYKLTSLPS